MGRSLYDLIGGDPAVEAAVNLMYDKVLADAILAPYFDRTNMARLRNAQQAFVVYAFGGPNHYAGQSLRCAHARSVEEGLNDHHFDRVAGHLKSAMEQLEVPGYLIEEALSIVEATRDDVLNRQPG